MMRIRITCFLNLKAIHLFTCIMLFAFIIAEKSVFASIPSDTVTSNENNIKILHQYVEKNLSSNPDSGLKYARIAYKLSIESKNNLLINNSLRLIALANKNLGSNYESIRYFNIFIEQENISDSAKIMALNNLGELYRFVGQLNTAMDFHIKALDFAKHTKKDDQISDIYINIGIIYRNIGDYKTARKYYDDALSISSNKNNKKAIINSLQAIGNWYWYSNNNDSALFYYTNAKKVYDSNQGISKSVEAGILNNIGNAYRNKRNFGFALDFYNKALEICTIINDNNLKSVVLKNIGILYLKKGNNIIAINNLKLSNEIAERLNLKRVIIENYQHLYEVYKNSGNYKLALESYIKYDNKKDSVYLNDNNYRISELEMKYKNKENQEIINTLQLNKDKNIKIFSSIISLILIVIIILLYKQFKYHKKESELRLQYNLNLEKLNEELKIQNDKINENRIQISDSEILFRTIFEDSPLGKILLDPNGNILKINDSLLKILGFTVSKELISQSIFQFPFLKKSNILDSFSKVIHTKKVIFAECNLKNNVGKQIILDYHISPILNNSGELIKIHAVATDITEEKQQEQIIVDSEKKLKELIATKDKFLSIIAHDIKNPFNAIMGFSNLLKDDYESFTNEERLQFITNISQASEDVFNLLENLLKWSWAQSGKIAFIPQSINLTDICNETLSLVKLQSDKKNIKIISELDSDVMVYADANMIRTVFRNLLSNSIKFTPNDGLIMLSYSLLIKPEHNLVQICIKDNGVGMSEDILSKLFKIEEKITSKGTNGENGTGLGLILCKEFVNKNGGEIWAESEENNGSKFYFTIPAAD